MIEDGWPTEWIIRKKEASWIYACIFSIRDQPFFLCDVAGQSERGKKRGGGCWAILVAQMFYFVSMVMCNVSLSQNIGKEAYWSIRFGFCQTGNTFFSQMNHFLSEGKWPFWGSTRQRNVCCHRQHVNLEYPTENRNINNQS